MKNCDIIPDHFSWKLFIKCDDLSPKLKAICGIIHWGKLNFAARIYGNFEHQTNCQVLPDILHFERVSPKKDLFLQKRT